MLNPERIKMRQFFFTTWEKYQTKKILEPLEQQLIDIILQHPEYHKIFSDPEKYLDKDYFPEFGDANPFLHLSLHLSVLEQVGSNRPNGITVIYSQLIKKLGNALAAEHAIMQLISENLWQAQQSGRMISDEIYLQQLKNLIKK